MCTTRNACVSTGLLITGVSTFLTFCILVWAGSVYDAKPGIKDSPIIIGVLMAGFVGCSLCFLLRILQLRSLSGRGTVHPILVSHHLLLLTQLLTLVALIWHLLVTVADAMAIYLYRKTVNGGRDEWLWIPPVLDLIVFLVMFAHLFMVLAEMIQSCFKANIRDEELSTLIVE